MANVNNFSFFVGDVPGRIMIARKINEFPQSPVRIRKVIYFRQFAGKNDVFRLSSSFEGVVYETVLDEYTALYFDEKTSRNADRNIWRTLPGGTFLLRYIYEYSREYLTLFNDPFLRKDRVVEIVRKTLYPE